MANSAIAIFCALRHHNDFFAMLGELEEFRSFKYDSGRTFNALSMIARGTRI